MAAVPLGVDPWTIPCAPPPEGVEPNFHKRSSLMDLTIVIVVLVLSSMATTMILRFWVIHRSREAWKMDDWFTIGTFVLTVAQGIMQCFQTKHLGFDAWDIPFGRLISTQTHQMFIATTVTGPLMLFAGKCCILAFYYRVFAHMNYVRCEIYGALFLSLSLVISAIVMPIYMGPAAWKGPSPTGTISGQLTLAIGVIKFVVDILIFYIPIPVVINLNLSTKKKMGVLTTFLTGSIAIVADIIDLYFRVEASKGKRPFVYSIYFPLCSLVEAGISVIVASMPSAAKIWRRHIVGSCVYNIVRSKFPESKTPTVHELPADLQVAKEKAAKKRRFGLYSIPTLMTTQQDTARTLTTTQQHQTDSAGKLNDKHTVRESYATSEKTSTSFDSSSHTPKRGDHV